LVVPESQPTDADEPGTGFGAVYDVFQLLATEQGAASEFKTGLQASLLNAFPLVTVQEVVVEPPRMTQVWVEVPSAAPAPTAAPTAAPTESSGGGGAFYIIVFVLFLAVGGGAYYYLQVHLPEKEGREKHSLLAQAKARFGKKAAADEGAPLTQEGGARDPAAEGERSMV
jgi:hypothetical protein